VQAEREFIDWGKQGPAKIKPIESEYTPQGVSYLDLHTRNFVDAVKAGDPRLLNTPIESGAVAAVNAHMGNIAYKTGDRILWDDENGEFKDNAEANRLTRANYHNGWSL
jgi:hypothetical protein